MALRIQSMGGCVIVAFPPEVDGVRAAEVDTTLGERVWDRSPPTGLVLDLSPVQFIDSPGLAVIARACGHGQERGVDVRIVAPTPTQRRLLDRMGVEDAAVYDTVPLAVLDSLSGRAPMEGGCGGARDSGGGGVQTSGPGAGEQGRTVPAPPGAPT